MDELDTYVEAFRQEAEELLVDIEESLLILDANPTDMDTIGRLFRAMHTIKGSGAMFGFDAMAAFTHHLETVLDRVRHGDLPFTRRLIDLVLASRDQIALMVRQSGGDSARSIQEREEIIAGLSQLLAEGASEPSAEAAPAVSPQVPSSGTTHAHYRIRFTPDQGIFAYGTDPALLLDELRGLGECEVRAIAGRLPDLREMDPELCYLAWEIDLKTCADENAITDVFIFVEDTSAIEIEPIGSDEPVSVPVAEVTASIEELPAAPPREDPTDHVAVQDSAQPAKQKAEQSGPKENSEKARNETIRVPSDKLDSLVNLVGELVITQAQLRQIADSSENPALSASVELLDRLAAELRDVALSIRMLPIGTSFGRFKRLVRDLALELGKEIELVTEGAETELDKTVIDRLSDPLVHLIRNSIDHGIESPEVREQSGKPRGGTIRLAASQHGGNVVITIEDDGKGIDPEVIRAKAVSTGLISADQELSDSEVLALIFAPGFSTASQVTSVSGRGVGMDVVKREIDSLGGSVSISSRKGQGSVIDLSLPLTLAIVDGLLLAVGEDKFVAPLSLVEGCLELTDSDLAVGRGRSIIRFRDEIVPFVRLREMFDIGSDRPDCEEMIIINQGRSRLGIVVDQVIGDYQTVIKSLGGMYKDVEGVSGATILGDGAVALILDVDSLARCAELAESRLVTMAGRSA